MSSSYGMLGYNPISSNVTGIAFNRMAGELFSLLYPFQFYSNNFLIEHANNIQLDDDRNASVSEKDSGN